MFAFTARHWRMGPRGKPLATLAYSRLAILYPEGNGQNRLVCLVHNLNDEAIPLVGRQTIPIRHDLSEGSGYLQRNAFRSVGISQVKTPRIPDAILLV
nr:hypothetical protein [Microvirga sp. KLBC 81]